MSSTSTLKTHWTWSPGMAGDQHAKYMCSGWLTNVPRICVILCNLFHSTSEYEKCFPSKNVSLMLTLQWDFILTHILWLPLQEGCIGCAPLSKPVHGSSCALDHSVMECLWTQRWPERRKVLSIRSGTIPEWWDALPTEARFISHRYIPFTLSLRSDHQWSLCTITNPWLPVCLHVEAVVLDVLKRGGLREGWSSHPSCGH